MVSTVAFFHVRVHTEKFIFLKTFADEIANG